MDTIVSKNQETIFSILSSLKQKRFKVVLLFLHISPVNIMGKKA